MEDAADIEPTPLCCVLSLFGQTVPLAERGRRVVDGVFESTTEAFEYAQKRNRCVIEVLKIVGQIGDVATSWLIYPGTRLFAC